MEAWDAEEDGNRAGYQAGPDEAQQDAVLDAVQNEKGDGEHTPDGLRRPLAEDGEYAENGRQIGRQAHGTPTEDQGRSLCLLSGSTVCGDPAQTNFPFRLASYPSSTIGTCLQWL